MKVRKKGIFIPSSSYKWKSEQAKFQNANNWIFHMRPLAGVVTQPVSGISVWWDECRSGQHESSLLGRFINRFPGWNGHTPSIQAVYIIVTIFTVLSLNGSHAERLLWETSVIFENPHWFYNYLLQKISEFVS